MVGRNSSGVATSGQNLGTVAVPWGVVRATSMVLNGASVDTGSITAPPNRVVSGKVRTTSNQPQFITPAGAASLSFDIDGTGTSLVYDVNGTLVTLSGDITKGSLTGAPSTNNTCLVDDTAAADQMSTRVWGEYGQKPITVDNMGSEISALVGKFAAFSVGSTEYFIAYVVSTTQLAFAMRGFFYNSSLSPVNRVTLANNDTITLLKMGFVYLEDDGATVDVSYTSPHYGAAQPSSPAAGDYWYDTVNNIWKRYDGASFLQIDRTLIGMFCNTDAGCVGARCIDFSKTFREDSQFELQINSNTVIQQRSPYSRVSAYGNTLDFGVFRPQWDIATDLATSVDLYDATEQASRWYYLFLTDTGAPKISDIHPHWRGDLNGWYHPHNTWRCVGVAYNDGSSNFTKVHTFINNKHPVEGAWDIGNGRGSTNTAVTRLTNERENIGGIVWTDSATLGSYYTVYESGTYAVNASYHSASSAGVWLSKNSTNLTTGTDAALSNGAISYQINPAGSPGINVGSVIYCNSNDIIRVQSGADASGADTRVFLKITKVG